MVISSAIDKFVYVIVKERFDDKIYINYSKKKLWCQSLNCELATDGRRTEDRRDRGQRTEVRGRRTGRDRCQMSEVGGQNGGMDKKY